MAVTSTIAVRMLTDWLPAQPTWPASSPGQAPWPSWPPPAGISPPGAAARACAGGQAPVSAPSRSKPPAAAGGQLNAFSPVVLAPYASTGPLLAAEQEAGRLHIHPALVVLWPRGCRGGAPRDRAGLRRAKVHHSYAATSARSSAELPVQLVARQQRLGAPRAGRCRL
ncbi:hypothetical protein QJS66_19540 [Kocuria rhizophila]|nr:hypothetical protein QJS66_19540 [Kocuria rhizophila]